MGVCTRLSLSVKMSTSLTALQGEREGWEAFCDSSSFSSFPSLLLSLRVHLMSLETTVGKSEGKVFIKKANLQMQKLRCTYECVCTPEVRRIDRTLFISFATFLPYILVSCLVPLFSSSSSDYLCLPSKISFARSGGSARVSFSGEGHADGVWVCFAGGTTSAFDWWMSFCPRQEWEPAQDFNKRRKSSPK